MPTRRVPLDRLRPDGEVVGIPDFPGYGASRDGRIWTCILPGPARRLGSDWREIAQWKAGPERSYWYVQLFVCSVQRKVGVHRLLLRTFRGEPAEDQQCRHLNGNGLDNRLDNLAWGTRLENAHDRDRHGTTARGFRLPQTKLSDRQRQDLVSDRDGGMSWGKLGAKYGITRMAAKSSCVRWKARHSSVPSAP